MNRRSLIVLIILLVVGIAVSILTLTCGYADWSVEYLYWNPILHERLPRLIILLCTGASLAVAGAVMQALFCNPLASPGILGINAGGSLLTLCVFILSLHMIHPFLVPLAAFSGCLLTLMIVYGFSLYIDKAHSRTLIFVGIAFSTVLSAIEGSITYAFRDNWPLLQTILEWQAGVTSDRTWQHVNMQLPLSIIGLGGVWWYAREIDMLTLGEEDAKNLGVNTNVVRWRLFLFVSMLTGGSMAALGIIPFFGLVLPHIVRRMLGPRNIVLLPFCALAGGVILAALDLFLRVMHIYDFSIGNLCSIIGGIFFLGLLLIYRRQLSK